MRFPATGNRVDVGGGVLDFNYPEKGIDFPSTATSADNNSLHIIAQIPHSWVEGSSLYPHLHWIQNQNEPVAWEMSYRWYNNNEIVPSSYSSTEVIKTVFPYVSNNLLQISTFPILSGTGMKISSFLDIKISRVGVNDNYTGDALYKEFDVHFQSDLPGSRQEFIK